MMVKSRLDEMHVYQQQLVIQTFDLCQQCPNQIQGWVVLPCLHHQGCQTHLNALAQEATLL